MTTEKPALLRPVHRFLEQIAESGGPLTSAEARRILDQVAERTNVQDAVEIVSEIDQVRAVIRELRAAFARSELDGGVKAAPNHPLYRQCEARLEELHEQLMLVI
ncbi:hypothetical protein SEA_PEPE25_12 [Microbacterium phage Pepe25]|nr:hypothetical protein SEA_PEPE25_12 [Microbacterium phage Pepe25]